MPLISRRDFHRQAAGGLCTSALAGVCSRRAFAAEDGLSFGLIADAQYRDAPPAGSRFYRRSLDKLEACVEDFNSCMPAFVIHLGDFIDHDFASFDAIQSIYGQLRCERYHVLGNHDFAVAPDKKGEVPRKLGMSDRYYSFRRKQWRFIVLDGNDLSVIARHPGTPEYEKAQAMLEPLKTAHAANAQRWNGGLGESQLDWLDGELSQADKAGERAIVFCHFPIYPRNVHNLWNDESVLRTFASHECVVAYINGHNHAGNYGFRQGIHYLTLPGMVETEDTTSYALATAQADGLKICGRGRAPRRTLSF